MFVFTHLSMLILLLNIVFLSMATTKSELCNATQIDLTTAGPLVAVHKYYDILEGTEKGVQNSNAKLNSFTNE